MKSSKRPAGVAAVAKRRERRRNMFIFGGIGVIVVALVVAAVVLPGLQPGGPAMAASTISGKYQEETYPLQEAKHIQRNELHAPYNSNPPTSGPHYADKPNMMQVHEGFYDDTNRQVDEDVVHSMEHGYVVIWYDCTKVPQGQCESLKSSIRTLIKSINGGYHLIANPRTGNMETMLALTSWGHLLRLDAFDPDAIRDFIDRNLNQAPEPGGP